MAGRLVYKYNNHLIKYIEKDKKFSLEIEPLSFLSFLRAWILDCPPKEILDDFEKVILEDFHYFVDRIKIMIIEKVDGVEEIFKLILKFVPNLNDEISKYTNEEISALSKMNQIILHLCTFKTPI
jgi:hypothetical protein